MANMQYEIYKIVIFLHSYISKYVGNSDSRLNKLCDFLSF